VMLREYEQLAYQDIADVLRIPLNTVRTRLFRAREDLRAALLRRACLEPAASTLEECEGHP
jgi:DNA-directed RNA polymerase specialized sigma24 family protein